jgi:hypothetical protein
MNHTDNKTLRYKEPAAKWHYALQIGNSKLGAMVYGGTKETRFALNEETLWSGTLQFQPNNPQAKDIIPQIQNIKMILKPVKQRMELLSLCLNVKVKTA